jgi:archaellum component FlaC
MKNQRLILPLLVFLLFSSSSALFGQGGPDNTPVVQYTQGKITSGLPYGRHFFIKGTSKLPNGAYADKVRVRLWPTGRRFFNRKKQARPLDANETAQIFAEPPLDSAVWFADRAVDTLFFKLYISRSLDIASEYMLEFTFYERMKFELSENDKDVILANIGDRVYRYFRDKGGIQASVIKKIIDEEVNKTLTNVDSYGENFPGMQAKSEYQIKLQPGTEEQLAKRIGSYTSSQALVEMLDLEIQTIENDLKNMDSNSDDFKNAQEELNNLKQQREDARTNVGNLKEDLPKILNIIREQYIETYASYVIPQPNELSKTQLEAVRLGSSFGAGAVGLNFLNEDARDLDVFGYTAIKFYLFPVDKRISDPYINDLFFINRLSLLVGISISGDLNYKGNTLEKAIGVYPVGGISYDVNRFLSIDLGGTLFRQNSLSPLTNANQVRVAPIIGINFDADLFNRFKTLGQGEPYVIPGN